MMKLVTRMAAAAVMTAAAHGALANDAIVLGTNWVAEAEHGGFYQAIADGTYAKYGLDVTIKQGGPQVNTLQMLFGGSYDVAVVSNSFSPINAVKAGAPFLAIAAMFQKDPQILMARPEMGYKSLADLKSAPILMASNARVAWWPFLKAKFGFTDDQARPYTYSLAPFLADKTTVQSGYATNEPFMAEAAGVKPTTFLLADHGYTSYATLLMTSKTLVGEKPDVLQRFVDASVIGWRNFVYGDNSKAAALIYRDNPDYMPGLVEKATKVMNEAGIVDSGDSKSLGIGAMTDARWKMFFDAIVEYGLYPADLDLKAAYTTQFVNKKVGL